MAFLIVDLGLALALFGLMALLLPRRLRAWPLLSRLPGRGRGCLLFLLGAGVAALGLLLPPPREQRVIQRATLLDDWMPRYEFVERHEILVHASPERAYQAILGVTAREIRLFRLFVWLRRPRLPLGDEGPVSILRPEADRPILESARQGGFLALERQPGEEVVYGTVVLAAQRAPADWGPSAFRQLLAPGYAKAAINFRVLPEPGGGCRVTTETRVHATDLRTRRRFAAYWRTIDPGSWILRVTWLQAIRDRAERTPAKASVGVPF